MNTHIKFKQKGYKRNAQKPVEIIEVKTFHVELQDIMQSFRGFLLAIGFSPVNVDEYIKPD